MSDFGALPVEIAGEHAGSLLAREGMLLTLVSPKPYPPGQPLRLSLILPDGSLPREGRSLGSKKRQDGSYELRLRLINLRREGREALERAVPAG
jgi:hypothetical protein